MREAFVLMKVNRTSLVNYLFVFEIVHNESYAVLYVVHVVSFQLLYNRFSSYLLVLMDTLEVLNLPLTNIPKHDHHLPMIFVYKNINTFLLHRA